MFVAAVVVFALVVTFFEIAAVLAMRSRSARLRNGLGRFSSSEGS